MVKEFFGPPPAETVCAVCIPPGASLELREISPKLQRDLRVGPVERVTFTQTNENPNSYRDAVRFANGRELLIQALSEGVRVKVLDLSLAEELNLELLHEQHSDFLPVR